MTFSSGLVSNRGICLLQGNRRSRRGQAARGFAPVGSDPCGPDAILVSTSSPISISPSLARLLHRELRSGRFDARPARQ